MSVPYRPAFTTSVPLHPPFPSPSSSSTPRRPRALQTRATTTSDDESILAIAAPISDRITNALRTHRSKRRLLVGVTGAPGSGKSSVSQAAARMVGARCAVLCMDGFHYSRAELDRFPDAREAHVRRGAPFTFDVAAFARAVAEIAAGGDVCVPEFDHAARDPRVGRVIDANVDAVIVEGNYLLLRDAAWADVGRALDECWFLDVSIEVAMRRVMKRHVSELALSEQQAWERVRRNDRLNAFLVQETKTRAQFVVDCDANVSGGE